VKITEITVSAGRVVPHPRRDYANLRPSLSITANVEDGEEDDAVAYLQKKVDMLLDMHISMMLITLEAEYQAERKRQDEAYEQRQRERSLAAVSDADALDDDEIEDEEIPFETPGR
jgi:hypothetical protein